MAEFDMDRVIDEMFRRTPEQIAYEEECRIKAQEARENAINSYIETDEDFTRAWGRPPDRDSDFDLHAHIKVQPLVPCKVYIEDISEFRDFIEGMTMNTDDEYQHIFCEWFGLAQNIPSYNRPKLFIDVKDEFWATKTRNLVSWSPAIYEALEHFRRYTADVYLSEPLKNLINKLPKAENFFVKLHLAELLDS